MCIAWKEFYAITMAINTWGAFWQCRKILVHCDNQTIVSAWKNGSSKSPEIMALVCMLYFCAAYDNLMFVSSTFLVSRMILQMLFLVFSFKDSEEWHQEPTQIQMSSLLGLSKPSLPPPAVQILWSPPVNSAQVPSRPECLFIILLPF